MVEFPSYSMTRYAEELSDSLNRMDTTEWHFESLECHHIQSVASLFPGKRGQALASRLGRFVRYPALAKKERADIFHILDHSHANLISCLPRKKTIVTCHDIIPLLSARGKIPGPKSSLRKFTFPLRLKLIGSCARIITDSFATKKSILEETAIDSSKIEVIHLGINEIFLRSPDKYRDRDRIFIREKLGLPNDARIILHVGSDFYKNIEGLIHSFEILKNEMGESNVFIIRIGRPLNLKCHNIAKNSKIFDCIRSISGISTDEEMASYYRAADIFAFPSFSEGFGWPPLEAMACGAPIVASNAGSIPEIVEDAGFLFDPDDHYSMAKAFQILLTDHTIYQTKRNSGIEQAKKFSWLKCAQKTLEVYDSVRMQAAS